MNPYIEKYLELLWYQFEFDIQILSQPWMYYWLLVPALGYTIFFFFKWVVLTTPIWLPPTIVAQALRGSSRKKRRAQEDGL